MPGLVHAQSDRGVYIGAALGTFDYEEQVDDGIALSDSTSSYQLFGGYRLNDHVALEFGWGGTGDIEGTIPAVVQGLGPVLLDASGSYDIYSLEALGILPFDRLSLFGGLGYFSASLSGPVSLPGFGQIGELDGHERGAMVSLGLQRDFRLDLENLGVRGEIQWFDIDDVDAWSFGVGLVYRF